MAELEAELINVALSPAAPASEQAQHLPEFVRLVCEGRFGLAVEAAWNRVFGEEEKTSASKGAVGPWFDTLADRIRDSITSDGLAGEWLGLAVAALLVVAQVGGFDVSRPPESSAGVGLDSENSVRMADGS